MKRVIMKVGEHEYESKHEWDSLGAFHAASANGEIGDEEFPYATDSDTGLDAEYRMAE